MKSRETLTGVAKIIKAKKLLKQYKENPPPKIPKKTKKIIQELISTPNIQMLLPPPPPPSPPPPKFGIPPPPPPPPPSAPQKTDNSITPSSSSKPKSQPTALEEMSQLFEQKIMKPSQLMRLKKEKKSVNAEAEANIVIIPEETKKESNIPKQSNKPPLGLGFLTELTSKLSTRKKAN